jgi:Flp pilus assembly protein TadG
MNPGISMSRLMRRFVCETGGVSAVEFALVLPLMLTLYLGSVEVSQAISASRKVTLVSRAVADLTSQASTNITSADMTNMLNASSAIVSPFAAANLKVTVSCIAIDTTGNATVKWSETLNGTKRTTNSQVSVNDALKVPNSWLLWTEAQYDYTPAIGYVITGTMTLKDQMYMSPRSTTPASYNNIACK